MLPTALGSQELIAPPGIGQVTQCATRLNDVADHSGPMTSPAFAGLDGDRSLPDERQCPCDSRRIDGGVVSLTRTVVAPAAFTDIAIVEDAAQEGHAASRCTGIVAHSLVFG